MLFSLFENSCKLRDLILNLQQRHGNGFFFFGHMFSINDMGFLNDSFSARIAMASLSVFAVIGLLAILYARIFTFNKDRV